MSLRQRLITTFLLLALVTIVTGVVNLYIQQAHIEEMEETMDEAMPAVLGLYRVETATARLHRAISDRALLLAEEAQMGERPPELEADLAASAAAVEDGYRQLRAAIDQYETFAPGDDVHHRETGRRLAAAAETVYDEGLAFISLHRDGAPGAALLAQQDVLAAAEANLVGQVETALGTEQAHFDESRLGTTEAARTAATVTILFSLLSTALAIFLGISTAGQIAGPISRLQAIAARIGEGRLDQRAEIEGDREIVALGSEVNEMAAHLERHVAERERLTQDALAASRFKSELVARVSHELRTPLGVIMGLADMMQHGIGGPLSSEQEEVVERIIRNTHYLKQLVNELLSESRLEANQLALAPAPFALARIVNHVESTFGPLAAEKGVALQVEREQALPDRLWGDAARLEQIVTNLVGNAFKFTGEGYVRVSFTRPDEAHWAIVVEDSGPGIPPAEQAAIFEPFHQVDGSLTRRHGGTGLGLAIVDQLVKLMGGQVRVESETGHGSTFTVLLPLIEPPDGEPSPAGQQEKLMVTEKE